MPTSKKSALVPYWKSECGRAVVYVGDNLDVMSRMEPEQFHAVITDPPYLLHFMSKDWDKEEQELPTREIAFRAWLTGLIAGEGCFRIQRDKNSGYYSCHFSIHMRADESPMLRALARRTGLGRIVNADEVTNNQGVRSSPSVRWVIDSRSQCRDLANIIGDFPLYAKKQREFDLWKTALQEWEETPKGNRWTGPRDNTAMEKMWEETKTLRPFDEEIAASDFYPTGQPNYTFHLKWASEAFRIMRLGAHLISFGGTRTFHRLACAIEDAGFEERDCLMWLYGSGFPKGQDVGQAIDKMLGMKRIEPISEEYRGKPGGQFGLLGQAKEEDGYRYKENWVVYESATDAAHQWDGWNTSLKPAFEPVLLARKPPRSSVAECVLENGCGGLNIDGCRVGDRGEVRVTGAKQMSNCYGKIDVPGGKLLPPGRWPANVVLGCNCEGDGHSETCPVRLLDEQSGERKSGRLKAGTPVQRTSHEGWDRPSHRHYVATRDFGGDSGGASRFFYTAKADADDRPHGKDVVAHVTVKPLDLMRYLVRLVCARGAIVLDPFMGSGSTGCAAIAEGVNFVGIEQSQEYADIAVGRLRLALQGAPAVWDTLRTGGAVASEVDTPPPPKKLR